MNEWVAGLVGSVARYLAGIAGAWLLKSGFEASDVEQIKLGIVAIILGGFWAVWRHLRAKWEKKSA